MMDLSVVPYAEMGGRADGAETEVAGAGRYRECMRNHAAAMGGQAYDGCGEFMPGGECGTLEALKCAACGCHRNFHRRDDRLHRRPLLIAPPPSWDKKAPSPHAFPAAYLPPPAPPHHHALPLPLPLPFRQIHPGAPVARREGSETPPRCGGGGGGGSAGGGGEGEEQQQQARKRSRTKFTAEQKEKMHAFAERVGWRIQRHDEAALEAFCGEVGIKRHVLKVWMHNNKHALASSSPSAVASPTAAAAAANPKPEPATAPPIRV